MIPILLFIESLENPQKVNKEINIDIFLDREAESVVYEHISDEGLGPKIYGYGPGIRI